MSVNFKHLLNKPMGDAKKPEALPPGDYPAVIKGKHMHKLQTDHLCVIKGLADLHLEDGREWSRTFGKKDTIPMGAIFLFLRRRTGNGK